MLNNLVLYFCKLHLHPIGKFIRISNSNLSGLTITTRLGFTDIIVLSTLNLSSPHSLVWSHSPGLCMRSFVSSTSIYWSSIFSFKIWEHTSSLIIWLQVLANYLKILTLSSQSLIYLQVLVAKLWSTGPLPMGNRGLIKKKDLVNFFKRRRKQENCCKL
jgi:hypothetical protein